MRRGILSQSATGALEVEETTVVEFACGAAVEVDIKVVDEAVAAFDDCTVIETGVEVDDVFVDGVDAGAPVEFEVAEERFAAPGLIAKTPDPGLFPSAQVSPPSKR